MNDFLYITWFYADVMQNCVRELFLLFHVKTIHQLYVSDKMMFFVKGIPIITDALTATIFFVSENGE